MNNLVKIEAFSIEGLSLEDILFELKKFGFPRIHSSKHGWHVSVEVTITPIGCTFEAKSDFGLDTPHIAAIQCHNRLRQAIKELTS